MHEISKSLITYLSNNVEDPEWEEVLEAAAFNLEKQNGEELLNDIDNIKHPPSTKRMKGALERNILRRSGDQAWIELHK